MGKITQFKDVLKSEKTRGHILTIDSRCMNNNEIIELIEIIKKYEERYSIQINPRQHVIKHNQYLLSIDFKTEAQKTFIKLFLVSNEKYNLYKRVKTWKELA